VTLEEFIPSWFYTKSTQDNVETSYFNPDKEEIVSEASTKLFPIYKEETIGESSLKVSLNKEEETIREISSMMYSSSSENPVEPSSQEVHECDTKITFMDNDLLFGETMHNLPLYMVGHMLEKKINKILIDDRFSVNILPIHTLKELGITTEELTESCLLI